MMKPPTKTGLGLPLQEVMERIGASAKAARLREARYRFEAQLRELERQFDAKARELSGRTQWRGIISETARRGNDRPPLTTSNR